MHRADHPSSCKRGGVCIFYKATLPLRVLNISNLNDSINFESPLLTKFYALFICRDPRFKRKTNFKYSNQN